MASPTAPVSAPPAAPAAAGSPSSGAAPAAPASVPSTAPAPPAAAPGTGPGTRGAGDQGTAPPAAAPAAPAAPVKWTPQADRAPANTDFPNTREGQYEFLKAHSEWEKTHPAGAAPAAAAPEPAKPAEGGAADVAAAAAAQEPPKPAEPQAEAATPQRLAELMTKSPEFGAFMEAHPEVKGPLFETARQLAAAAPILEIVPTIGDAKFMQDASTSMVTLKTAALRTINNPESLPQFLDTFDQQFQQVNADGTPKLDAQGQPIYDADHGIVVGGIVNREVTRLASQYDAEFKALEQKLAGVYPNDQAKAMDQQRLDNLDYALTSLRVLDQLRTGEFFKVDPPELAADATPAQKAWFDQQKAELAEQQRKLEEQRTGADKDQRSATAKAFNLGVRNDMGTSVGQVLGETLRQVVDSGAYIPEFYLQEKYRTPAGVEMNTPRISAEIFLAFENELMRPGSRTLQDIVQHELLPQNDQTRALRKEWYARKAAEIVPRLVSAEVDRIQKLVKVDADKQEAAFKRRSGAASPEPTSPSSLPQGASDEQILQQAEANAAKLPEWKDATPRDKQAMILTAIHRLRKK